MQLFDHVAYLGRLGPVGFQPEIFLIFVEGGGAIALLQADIREQDVSRGEIGSLLHDGFGERSGFLPAASGPIGFGEFVLRAGGIGAEVEAFLERFFRTGIIFGLVAKAAEIEIRSGKFRLEFDAALQGGFGLLPVLFLKVGFAEQAIGLRGSRDKF